MLLAAVAAATKRLRLATTSYLLPLRNPLLAAEQVAVLDQLCNGRTLLGIGRGYSNETLRAFGIDPGEKRERFAWSLDLMRRAWRGEPVAVREGDAPVTVAPRPVQFPIRRCGSRPSDPRRWPRLGNWGCPISLRQSILSLNSRPTTPVMTMPWRRPVMHR